MIGVAHVAESRAAFELELRSERVMDLGPPCHRTLIWPGVLFMGRHDSEWFPSEARRPGRARRRFFPGVEDIRTDRPCQETLRRDAVRDRTRGEIPKILGLNCL